MDFSFKYDNNLTHSRTWWQQAVSPKATHFTIVFFLRNFTKKVPLISTLRILMTTIKVCPVMGNQCLLHSQKLMYQNNNMVLDTTRNLESFLWQNKLGTKRKRKYLCDIYRMHPLLSHKFIWLKVVEINNNILFLVH